MSKALYQLVIGDKNYSSWSLRGWLALRPFGLDFDEILVELRQPDRRAAILAHSPSGKVPALKIGELVLWDSLAIAETIADRHPDIALWPEDWEDRALARAVVAEMHAGFYPLRSVLPMDLLNRIDPGPLPEEVSADIRRIIEIWKLCRARPVAVLGDMLFGTFTLADAFYAPVVTRLVTYGVDLPAHGDDGTAAAYCEAVMALPVMGEWTEGALAEMRARRPEDLPEELR